jgi:hypothetical protein
MVLPVTVRKALGLVGESRVTLTLDDAGVSLQAMAQHVLRAQRLYKEYVTAGNSVDEFLIDR